MSTKELIRRSKVKRHFQVTLGKMLQPNQVSPNDSELWYLRSASIQWNGVDFSNLKKMWFTPEEKIKLALQYGDLLICEGGDVGRSALWNKSGTNKILFQNSVNRVRARRKNSTAYLYYWMVHLHGTGLLDIICNKSTIAHLTAEKLNDLDILIGDNTWQRQIAAYLNRETAKIDKLIAKQQKLIKLLQEKRQAVISQAVTKGLDSNVKMKDSGVEWLGEVPFTWTVTALKFVCDVRDGTHETPAYVEPSVNSRPLVTSKDISGGVLNLGTTKHISFEDFSLISRRSQVGCGDVLMPMIGTVGGAFIVENECDFAIKNIALFKKSSEVTSNWLADYLDSNATRYQFDLNRSGGVQSFVSLGTLRNLIICVPPLDQQFEMVNKLSEVTAKIDRLIDKGATSIELLKEHRQALITAAVTGKIDVRGLVTNEEVAALDAEPEVETTEEDFASDVLEDSYITEEE